MTLLTVIRPDSVRFQKDFQKCKSRFWVIRSNSMPRNSGSMTYFPDVRRERAAIPKPDCCLPYVSPYEIMLMTTVWRNGRRLGEN